MTVKNNKIKTRFALRSKETGHFLTKKPVTVSRKYGRHYTGCRVSINLAYSVIPTLTWATRHPADILLSTYEIERFFNSQLPVIEIAEIEHLPRVIATFQAEPTPKRTLETHRLSRNFNKGLSQAYSLLSTDTQYKYAIRRKGCSYLKIEEMGIEGVRSRNIYTFIETDDAMVQLKLALSPDDIATIYSLCD